MPKRSASSPSSSVDRPIRVVVVDDHPCIREALAATLEVERDLVLCGSAATADETFRVIDRVHPDVVIVDLSLPDTHGLELVQVLHVVYPEVQIVVFSLHDEQVYAERVLRAGAGGYLMKTEPTRHVVDAIRCVAGREVYLSHQMAALIFSRIAHRDAGPTPFTLGELTDREVVVFQMIGEGYTLNEIAARMSLTRKTVEAYRRRTKEKLELSSIADLVRYAVQFYGTGRKRPEA